MLVSLGKVQPFFDHWNDLVHLQVAEHDKSNEKDDDENGVCVYSGPELLLLALHEVVPLNNARLLCCPDD